MSNVIFAADLFCGAGGTSTGLLNAAQRLGKRVNLLAINHWQVAIDTHQANHPGVRHLTAGLESVTPANVVPGGKLDLLWASPSCTHHSVARGGRPRCDQSRAQPHLLLDWLDQLYVKRVMIENVPEFVNWGPLGYDGKPLKSKRGVLFEDYLRSLEARGYRWEWRILCCADYGDATTRERFFLQAVKGRERIRWPEPTHAKNPGRLFGEVKPWVTAREIIDWSIPGKSIFTRDRPLAENTLRRIEAGIRKFWGEWAEPFLILLRGTRSGALKRTAVKLDAPLPTLTAGGGHVGLVQPFLVPNFTEKVGQSPRTHAIGQPLPAVTGHGAGALIEPFIIPQHSCGASRGMEQPIPTITTDGAHALVEPFLVSFYGTDNLRKVSEPVATVTVKDRFGLVQQYGLDILFRMLQPHELALAHSFPKTYRFAGNKGEVVKQIGNSVPSRTSEALCLAALADSA